MSEPTARWPLARFARSLYRRLTFATRAAGVIVKATLALSFRPRHRRTSPPGGNQDDRTLLIVSYYSPPYKSIYGTQRIAKFAKYLSKLKWRVVLVTTSPGSREEAVSDDPLPPEVEVTRIAPVRSHPFWGNNQIPPDDFVLWIPEAVEAIGKILERTRVSVILATVPPYSNAVAAAICARQFDVPLVTDFRDPWTRLDFFWGLKRAWAKRVSAGLERMVLKASARVVMADRLEDFAEYFADTTPATRAKTVSILNGYDESDFDSTEEAARKASGERAAPGKFVVSYVGNLYAREVAAMLIGAFEAWRALCPEDLAHVVFQYAGGQSSYLDGARALPLEFKDFGFVPHKQAIAIRAASDLQLFTLPPSVKSHCLSGKIYEMIRARVPILAFTSSRGAAAELLRLTGAGAVIEPDDRDGAGRSLKQLYDEWVMHGRIAPQSGSVAVEEFSRRALAARLDGVLREVAGR